MKLISCYIENFGGLSRYSLDFSQGVTVIEEPNGFGKTTLAEFLRAMFYGFPRKAKTLDKSKRQKYTPWGGGKFGGNLVFEFEGKQYRLERTFGATPKGDSFNLFDLTTNRKSDRFTENIGLELFQLDGDSFERSTYLPQMQEGIQLTTAGIQAKLTDLVEDTNDLGNFDKAITALKSSRSAFVPYRGNGGSVAEAASQVTALQRELDRVTVRKEQLESCNEEIAETEEKILQCRLQAESVRSRWEQASESYGQRLQYEDCRRRCDENAAVLQNLENAYPMGIPGDEELEEIRQIYENLAILENAELTGQERLQYEQLRKIREAGLLEEERLDALAEQNRQWLRRRAALETMEVSREDREQLERFRGMFAYGMPHEGVLEDYRRKLKCSNDLRAENLRLAQSEKKANPWLVIPGMALLVAGLLLTPLGAARYVLAGIGVALAAAGIVMVLRSKGHNQKCREALARNEAAIAEYEKSVADFVRPFSTAPDLAAALESVQRNITAARELEEKLRRQREKYDAQATAADRMEAELYRQLGQKDFDKVLSDLRLAREKLLQWDAQISLRQQRIEVLSGKLDAFFGRFGLIRKADVRSQLQQIYDDGRSRKMAQELAQQLAQRLAQFPRIPEGAADLEGLKQTLYELEKELEMLTEQLLRQRQNAGELRTDAERIPQLRDELESWQEKRLADQHKAQILDDTMSFLQEARDNLTTSYLGPIRQSFYRYLEKFTQVTGEKVFISPELDVQLERLGQARELGYFSAGQTDTVMLCMRLALVDALFGENKPFVILDDPFVNLDDDRTSRALALLRELGQERQIIYLTCNSSRSF